MADLKDNINSTHCTVKVKGQFVFEVNRNCATFEYENWRHHGAVADVEGE
jgi:hypothetical protein